MPIPRSTSVVDLLRLSSHHTLSKNHCSQMTRTLEKTWCELQRVVPDIPAVVLLVLSARDYSRRDHFSPKAWRDPTNGELLHEVAVHPGMLGSPQDLLATLLHEAAHAILWEKRSETSKHCCGVSWSGYYHRVEFRSAAQRLGLKVNFRNRRYGFCLTTWPEQRVPEEYSGATNILKQLQLIAARQLPSLRTKPEAIKCSTQRGHSRRAACCCAPPRSLRISCNQFLLGPIYCGACGQVFQLSA